MSLLDGLHEYLTNPKVDSIMEMNQDFHSDFDYVIESLTDAKLKTENTEVSHLLTAIDQLNDKE